MARKQVLIFFSLFLYLHSTQGNHQCSSSNCIPPDCYCETMDAPNHMPEKKIPQIVLFTFDDSLSGRKHAQFKELFTEDLLNPNGCPISATFYVCDCDSGTNYEKVKDLYDDGHEIGLHSISHRGPEWWWSDATYDELVEEFIGMRKKLIENAGIPIEDIKGLRCPFLQMGGDRLFSMMRDYGILYDSSIVTGPYKTGGLFPFTLDFPSLECENGECPESKFPGIWEIPINQWYSPKGRGCDMIDFCPNREKVYKNKETVLSYFRKNFWRHYNGNRAPIGANMHATWFQKGYTFEALKEFIRELVEMDDVYILTANQAIEWMKDPQTLETAPDFVPWQTSCSRKTKSGWNVDDDM